MYTHGDMYVYMHNIYIYIYLYTYIHIHIYTYVVYMNVHRTMGVSENAITPAISTGNT